MGYARKQLLDRIVDNIEFQSGSTKKQNVIGLFDDNRLAQDFYCGLFKLLCGYDKLVDLDKLNEKTNYAAIDLGDKSARIAIQITTDSSSTKIKDTLKKFKDAKLFNDYDRLIVLIIGKKEGYTTTFPTNCSLVFDHTKDVWDDDTVCRLLDNLENEQLEELDEFLEAKLADYKYMDHLSYEDIGECIDYIEQDINGWLLESINEARTLPPTRDKKYILRKNTKNGISDDFFTKNIKGHLKHNQLIDEFLRDPVNKSNGKLQSYYLVTQSIQEFYSAHRDEYKSFEEVFVIVFGQIKNDYNRVTGIEKVKIVLHNMYFNCDIGDNPDD
jgi:hypothetical protein